MRASPALLALGLALAVAACGEGEEEVTSADLDTLPGEPAAPQDQAPATIPQADIAEATPMEERVATIGLLNKRNNVSQDFEMKPGETAEDGPVIIRMEACERTAPYEFPQETGAFVQVDVRERGAGDHSRIFSGWLFKENPSLNVVEHPIYDVWVKDCAMSFPGDE
jgi:hypothetical protein